MILITHRKGGSNSDCTRNVGATKRPEELEITVRRGLVMRGRQQQMAPDEEPEKDEEQEQKEIIDRQIRTHKALQYMERELQLPTATVMPVLLKLMKAYDGNWEFIEADNYHVLVDTIFAMQESEEAEKAPGSSSGGSARKSARKEKKPGVATRATPRRAPRNSKRAESDDSDENDGSQELIRRIRGRAHAAAAATTPVRPIATSEAKRKALYAAEDDDNPAWDQLLLALPAPLRSAGPQCQLELPSGGGRRELRRLSTGQPVREVVTAVNKETQTEPSGFNPKEPIHQPVALLCYEETPAEKTLPLKLPVVKQEKGTEVPMFLSDFEVRRQLLNQVGALPEICKTCDKPRPVRFDPSKVKVEAQASAPGASGSGKHDQSPSIVPSGCLNPAPLQAVVPIASLPFEPTQDEHPMEFHSTDPEPLLLTFPATDQNVPDTAETCAEPVAEQMQGLVPCSEKLPAMQEVAVPVDTNCRSSVGMNCQPVIKPASEATTVVENPLMKPGLPSKVEVKELPKIAENSNISVTKVEEELQQQPSSAGCENLTTDGALGALASYISESDHSDVDMLPKLKPELTPSTVPVCNVGEVINTSSCCPNEGVKADAQQSQGILPLANISSIHELQSNAFENPQVESFPEQSRDALVIVEVQQTLPMASTAIPHEEASSEVGEVAEMGRTSSESSKKRKRTLIKLKDLEEHSPIHGLDHIPPRQLRHDPRDISRGKEKVPISLCKDPARAKDLPADFSYINASVVYQSAHVGISMARIGEDDRCSGCVGNCLDNRVPCECTRLTDGEYAYTVEGCLYPHFLKQELERKRDLNLLSYCQPGACPVERTNDEVCKGHVQRRFIKECWEKCGCTQLCGNRIVQRGVVHRLQVFWTEGGKGWGIRTLEPLRAGTFVCEYVGEILTNTEMWHRNNDVHGKAKHHFSLQLDADWCSERYLKDEEALCLDGTCFGNVARFINHRCIDTNLIEIPVEIESPDHHYYHLAFFTSKDVNQNEELTWVRYSSLAFVLFWRLSLCVGEATGASCFMGISTCNEGIAQIDYGLDFNDKDHQIQAFECFCGSTFCRGKMEGEPWV